MSPAVKKMVQKHSFEGTERVEAAIQASQASGNYATSSEFIREAIDAYAVALGYLEPKPPVELPEPLEVRISSKKKGFA